MLMAVGEYEADEKNSSMDEFAVPQGCEKELRDQRPHVERLFGVVLNILGVLSQAPLQPPRCQQMWLQLQGNRRNIELAKDYIKGLCTPEIIEDISYPREMHCIFVGSKGIFLDCLIRATSACVKPLTPGRIRISGLVEGAVMAQSRVHAFLEVYNSSNTPENREAHIKRSFKDLVEEYNDNHALDLLILPTSIKEQLLDLVQEDNSSGLMQKNVHVPKIQKEYNASYSDKTEDIKSLFPGTEQFQKIQIHGKGKKSNQMDKPKEKSSKRILHQRACEPGPFIGESADWDFNNHEKQMNRTSNKERLVVASYEEERQHHHNENSWSDTKDTLFGDDNEEFEQISGLLGTIMGRDEGDSVSQGHFSLSTQKEFKMLLDFFKTMGYQEALVLKVLSENGIQEPSEILDKVKQEQSFPSHNRTKPGSLPQLNEKSYTHSSSDDDYLLEVVKSAAKNCGYSPSEIVDIGDGSVAGLLWKLNEKNSSEDAMASSNYQRPVNLEPNQWHEEVSIAQPRVKLNIPQLDLGMSDTVTQMGMFDNHPVEDHFPVVVQNDNRDREEVKKITVEEGPSVTVVTGAQRFNEAMQNPFQLTLKDEKGNDQLRYIIIDGSNVAMIHGLQRFFSCRGIALAVQYFWDRGHRHITVFVPQWRMKKDSKIKEQHFLTQLNDIGLLSFTPSRTIEGKRITSYDDRFMLHLAEKTDGIIVTNDNLRDIYYESDAWKNIIKGRLLQFTFVGDIFMVPDDPLGRNGPPLDTFLCRTPQQKAKSKGHSYAGRRGPHSSPKPSSQTEILNLRDRKPVGHRVEEKMDVRSRGETERLRKELLQIFPSQNTKVDFILQREPYLNDLNKLSELIITLKF
ncbi:protein KHNYN-like [Pelodytes ibericus]